MKKSLIYFLFLPIVVAAQQDNWEAAYLQSRPEGFGTIIQLPEVWENDFAKVFELGQRAYYFYSLTQDSVYRRVFAHYPEDSLRDIDFRKKELFVYIACPQCLFLNSPGDDKPHHRNACMYKATWYLRPKKLVSY